MTEDSTDPGSLSPEQRMINARIQTRYGDEIKKYGPDGLNHALATAVQNNDQDGAAALIQKGADAANKDLLFLAIDKGNAAMAALLLYKAPELIDKAGANTVTPLEQAVKKQDKDMVAVLLDHSPDLAANNQNVLQYALTATGDPGTKKEIEEMILKKVPVELINKTFVALMGTGAENGLSESDPSQKYEIAKVLLQHGADANGTDISEGVANVSLLSLATGSGNAKLVKLLLEYGANPNIASHSPPPDPSDTPTSAETSLAMFTEGLTPLHLVAIADTGNIDIANLLVNAKADVNARSGAGQTPLMMAVEAGNLRMTEYLLSCKNIDVDIKDIYGKTALDYARAKAGMVSQEDHLIPADKKGLQLYLDSETVQDPSPASSITTHPGDSRLIVALLEGVKSGEVAPQNRAKPVSTDDPPVVAPSPASPDIPTPSPAPPSVAAKSNDALYDAVMKGDTNAVKTLLEKGDAHGNKFNINARYDSLIDSSQKQVTPLMLAALNNDAAMIKLLKEKGADITLTEQGTNFTALHMAAVNGNLEALKALIGDDPAHDKRVQKALETHDGAGKTALDEAAKRKDYDAVLLLGYAMHKPREDESVPPITAIVPQPQQQVYRGI